MFRGSQFAVGRAGCPGSGRMVRDMVCAAVLLCGSLAVWGQTSGSQTSGTSNPLPTGILVDVGGYRVHLHCTGNGSPTIFIVGAAFSFDWELVQREIAKVSRVCTFDPSGTAWSDSFATAIRELDPGASPNSAPTCEDRVNEIHRLIETAPIGGPLLLVGFSVGALWERLYAANYPQDIAGMVIVDHAFLPEPGAAARSTGAKAPSRAYTPPVLVAQAPMVLGFEDDVNFGRLPERDQALHRWALAQHPVRPGEAMVVDCVAQIRRATRGRSFPLGDLPLTVIRTGDQSPGYDALQTRLLALSRQSQIVMAWQSTHMVPIDEPDVIVKAIEQIVERERARGGDRKMRP